MGKFSVTRSLELGVLCSLLLLAFALRVFALSSDPPSMDVLPDQAPWTDEGTISLPSVEAIRGGNFSDGLVKSGRPLHSVALLTAYDLLGVGRFQGRLISVALGLIGLVALARTAAPVSDRGAMLALLFAGTGFFFVVYSRLILTEGIVVAALCVVAWFGIRAQSGKYALAVGVALGAIAVTLKLHALALLPGLALLYLVRRKRLLIPFLLGVGVVLLAWRVFWVASNGSYLGYVEGRLGGELLGAAPLQIGILQIFLAGAPWYYLLYQIPLFLLASLEILAAMLSPRQWLRETSDSTLVAVFWLLSVVVVVGLFRYTPPRYYHIASPAIVLIGIAGAKRLWEGQAFPRAGSAARIACAAILGLLLLSQFGPSLPLVGAWAPWMPLLGLPFPFIFLWLSTRNVPGWGWSPKTRTLLLSGLIVLQVLEQAVLYSAGVLPARMDLSQAATALARTVPQNAVIVGRLAGTLALLAPLQGYPIADWIDRDAMVQLSRTRSVWIVELAEHENDIDPRLRTSFVTSLVFPVNYSSKSRWFTVYQFSPTASESQ